MDDSFTDGKARSSPDAAAPAGGAGSIEVVVTEAEAGSRLDRFVVAHVPSASRQRARALLADGQVRVDDRVLRKGDLLRAGQRVTISLGPAVTSDAVADQAIHERAQLPQAVVVYQDAQLESVDTPATRPTHGLRADEPYTLTAQLLARYPEMRGVGYRPLEPGILHRLDNDTSGLLLAARTSQCFDALKRMLREGAIEKRYVALCAGAVRAPQVIESYLVSDRSARVKVTHSPIKRSRAARTELLQARTLSACSWVTIAAPHAGRHQIRAHLASIGHPLVGDALYGGPSIAGLDRHALHASALRFIHPFTQEQLAIDAPLPDDLQRVLTKLG